MEKERAGQFRTERRRRRMAEALARRQDDQKLVLDNIHDPHNVSAIYRSCDAFGVSRVFLYYTTTAFPVLSRKTSASARKWVGSERASDPEGLRASLAAVGFRVLATTFSPKAESLWDVDFLKPTAVILGNEHSGLDPELLAIADGELYIPMRGVIQSLNVSVAAAVILAEASRQRAAAGFYDSARIPPDVFEERLADWLAR